jgi:hypothetical protein
VPRLNGNLTSDEDHSGGEDSPSNVPTKIEFLEVIHYVAQIALIIPATMLVGFLAVASSRIPALVIAANEWTLPDSCLRRFLITTIDMLIITPKIMVSTH